MNTEIEKQQYRPRLMFYHANARGAGCALQLELHPAHDNTDGSIWLCAANQMTVGDRRGPEPTYARFDWEHKITVKLDFMDLSKILQVFRGETESLEGGKGLIHNSPTATTRILLRHITDPIQGYSFELYRSAKTGEDERTHFLFLPSEALGLSEAIAGSMSVISFGIPMVINRNRGEGAAEVKGSGR